MRQIVVRPLHEVFPNFEVTSETTISGCPVEALDLPPRACHPDGSPRLDLLNFRLRTRTDCLHFQRGSRVTVEKLRVIEPDDC